MVEQQQLQSGLCADETSGSSIKCKRDRPAAQAPVAAAEAASKRLHTSPLSPSPPPPPEKSEQRPEEAIGWGPGLPMTAIKNEVEGEGDGGGAAETAAASEERVKMDTRDLESELHHQQQLAAVMKIELVESAVGNGAGDQSGDVPPARDSTPELLHPRVSEIVSRSPQIALVYTTTINSSGNTNDGIRNTGEEVRTGASDAEINAFGVNLVLRTVVAEYHRLSEAILNREQELIAIQEQIRDGFADPDANMLDIIQLADSAARVKSSVIKDSHNRDSVVARYVLYIAQDPLEFETQLDESRAVDISHMQIICHCRLAQLGAVIREKRLAISTHKQLLESVVADWKSCVDEIVRLGALIVADEQVMEESEKEHVTEFSRLFQFSRQIRDAARKMMNSYSSSI